MISRLLLMFCVLVPGVCAAEFPPAPEDAFSIVVIPDTQRYRPEQKQGDVVTVWSNAVFDGLTRWTVDNMQQQRIVFVSHVGDIVDRNQPEQWQVARQCMDRLHGRVPYGISVGNHDMQRQGDSSLFQAQFPQSRFAEFDWYAGCYQPASGNPATSGNNANSCQLFSAGGIDMVFLHLECNAPDDVLVWADAVLQKHADRIAFVTTHMGLGPLHRPETGEGYFKDPKGRMQWKKCHAGRGNTPQQMWDKCFRKHANLRMICCGDQSRSQAMNQSAQGDHGNTVHELLSDYGAEGLRVLRFFPQQQRVEVRTWNPATESFCAGTKIVPDVLQHQFVLDFDFQVAADSP